MWSKTSILEEFNWLRGGGWGWEAGGGSPIGLSGRVDSEEGLGKCSKKGWELSPNAAGAKLERRETRVC